MNLNLLDAVTRINQRKRAYRLMFLDDNGNPTRHAEIILADLRRFCRVTASTAVVSPITKSVDPIAMAMAEGRREVWNRMMAHLHLPDRVVMNMTEEQ